MKRLEATEDNLAAEVKRWQKLLRLVDWKVDAKFVHQSDIAHTECATVSIFGCAKDAEIKIVWPNEFPEQWEDSRDWQHSLIHELIEVHCDRFKPEKGAPADMDAEVAINLIASALLELDRKAEDAGIIEVTETNHPADPAEVAVLAGSNVTR